MVMYKARIAGASSTGESVHALTDPSDILMFFKDARFTVEMSGCSIIYTSGAKQTITKTQLEKYSYEDCSVK